MLVIAVTLMVRSTDRSVLGSGVQERSLAVMVAAVMAVTYAGRIVTKLDWRCLHTC